jgi:hypothetical protein
LAKTATLALVGSESLMGREIRDLLSGNTLGQDLKLIATEREEVGKLTERGGEPAVLGALEEENLEFARVIFLAGSVESVQRVRELAPQATLIDLTFAAEEMPHAWLRAPMVEPAGYQIPSDSVHVIASAAAITLAVVLGRLHAAHGVVRALAQILEPASEREIGRASCRERVYENV